MKMGLIRLSCVKQEKQEVTRVDLMFSWLHLNLSLEYLLDFTDIQNLRIRSGIKDQKINRLLRELRGNRRYAMPRFKSR